MKKETKQILLVFLMIVMVISVCALVIGCDSSKNPAEDTGLTLPTSTTSTTSSTDTTTTTTTDGVNPPSTTTTSTTSTTKPVTPVETGTYTNPLTGLKTCTSNPSTKRPVAIVIDNISNAYKNQKGIYQADILYEIPTAPGITRYLAIIEDYENLSEICNIRSGRDYHLNIAQSHNAILVCHGGSITVNYDFYALAAQRLGNRWGYVDTMFEPIFCWADLSAKYGTIKNYKSRPDLQYDTLVNGTALKLVLTSSSVSSKYVKNGGTTTGTPKGFVYASSGTATMTNALTATELNVNFTISGASGTKYVTFKYDTASGKYIRYQDKKFSGAGETLSFKNVIILGTTITNAKTGISNDKDMARVTTSGSGTGYYFCGGKAIKISWSQSGNTPLKYYYYGTTTELALSAGNTYVGYVEKTFIDGAQFFA